MAMQVKPSQPRYSWLGINPGQLRNPITLSTASQTVDGFGQPLNTWSQYLAAWASIRLLSGQELFQGQEFSSAAQWRITLRWPGEGVTISVGDRVFFGAHVYVVQIVDNVEMRNILLQLTCLEIDGAS